VLSGDREAMAKLSTDAVFEIVLAVQSGMTVETLRDDVRKWLATAKHPRWNRPYTELVYQPMLEVLHYLRANGYRTFIATGGTAGFVRTYSDKVYGILRRSRSPAPRSRSNTATAITNVPPSPWSPNWAQ
jgi:phosphoserine phosphatase